MLNILAQPYGPYQVNTILVWCERTKQAVLFDPTFESEDIIEEIERRGLTLRYLVNTHGHLDHIALNDVIKAQFKVPLLIHELDRPMLTNPIKNLSLLTGEPITSPDADRTLKEGDTLQIGEDNLQVFHVPGHTPGSLVFYYPGFVITGD
ncbi:MBL fold metallo-hydrolase, partial [candidate division KSB1 bacterium]